MSHIRCPLCGKDNATCNFDPASLDDDIYVRQVYGLGRGQGFSHGPDESVLGDEIYSPMICNRCLDIVRLMIENNVITENEVLRSLKLGLPIMGTDKIVPYDEAINMTNKVMYGKEEIIEGLKVNNRALSSNNRVIRNELEGLKAKISKKKKIDLVLISFYNNSECEVTFNESDWILYIKNIDRSGVGVFGRELYPLNMRERNLVRERIVTENEIIHNIFDIFKIEPTIRDVKDMLENKPYFYDFFHEIF